MEQRNSRKNKNFFGNECRADIITRSDNTFFTFSIDFMIYWDTPGKYMNNKFQFLTNIYVCTGYFIRFSFLEKWDTPGKYKNNKFQFPTNKYVCTGYFIGFTFLENVVLLVRYLSIIW